MWLARLLFILIALSNWTAVHAKERMALVIGNADYTSSALVNSVNDAEDIASTLENLDFGVTLVKNATRGQMQAVISEFVGNLNDDTVGLFYYSGHAVQYKGNNYLIPIGTIDKLDRVEDLPKNTINTNTVLDGVNQSQSNLNFVFLDACRDNPFKNLSKEITPGLAKTPVGARSVSTNLIMENLSITRGVSETHEQVKDTKGILVAYSTMPGSVASDGSGRNSPYTKSLLKHITKTNSLAQIMLSDVQQDVENGTSGKQTPIFESAITGRFCFNEENNGCGKAIVNIHSSYLKGVKDIQKLTLADGSSYEGQVVDGKPSGKGVQVHKNGSVYEGEWKNGVSAGKGYFYDISGFSYKGDWKNDIRHGNGLMNHPSGIRYEGKFENDLPHGFGIQTWTHGSRYEGFFQDGKMHGQGVRTWANGSMLKGNFKDGKSVNTGFIIEREEGSYEYEGYIKNGNPHGKGIKKWVKGDVYDGSWENGKANGFGIYFWNDTNTRYEGEWIDDNPVDGIFTWKNGDRYEGDWKNGAPDGWGKFTWLTGTIHTGGWKNGKKNGYGVTTEADGSLIEAKYILGYPTGKMKLTLENGWIIKMSINLTDEIKKLYDSKQVGIAALELVQLIDGYVSGVTPEYTFKGGFKNGQRNGKGDIRWEDGSSYKGVFLDNLPHGEGVRVEIDGGRYKGNWLHGKRDGFGIQDYAIGDRYLGKWRNDLSHGDGSAFYEGGAIYKGGFSDGLYNGQGEYIWPDGNRYKGLWLNGVRAGQGVFLYKDSDSSKAGEYVGEFENDARHGYGVMTWENGDRYEGEWKDDKYHGNGLATTLDGYRYEGEWSDGKEVDKQ